MFSDKCNYPNHLQKLLFKLLVILWKLEKFFEHFGKTKTSEALILKYISNFLLFPQFHLSQAAFFLIWKFAKIQNFLFQLWPPQRFFWIFKKTLVKKNNGFGLRLLHLEAWLLLQIITQQDYKFIFTSYLSCCHLMLSPFCDASHWCNITKLKNNSLITSPQLRFSLILLINYFFKLFETPKCYGCTEIQTLCNNFINP